MILSKIRFKLSTESIPSRLSRRIIRSRAQPLPEDKKSTINIARNDRHSDLPGSGSEWLIASAFAIELMRDSASISSSKILAADRHDQGCPPESLSTRYPVISKRSPLCSLVLISECRAAPREPFKRHQGRDLRRRELAHAQLPPQGP